jgi:hypothetical protein
VTDRHAPRETVIDTETITCAQSGTDEGGGPEGQDVRQLTHGDVKAFSARLDELGAADDQLIENDGATIWVTLDRRR